MNENNMNNNTNTNQNGNDLSLPFFSAPITADGSSSNTNNVAPQQTVTNSVPNPEPVVQTPVPEPQPVIQPEPVVQQQPVQEVVQQPVMMPTEQPVQQQSVNLPPPKPMVQPTSQVGAAGNNDADKLLENDRFVIAYIGKDKYYYFLTKGWNWPFFFLGIYYLMYRKMYGKVFSYLFMSALVGIAVMLVVGLIPPLDDLRYSSVVGFLIVTFLSFSGPLFYHLYYTKKVNSIYYEFAQKKSKKVEYVFNNFDKEVQEKICEKRGRGTIKNFVVGFILYTVLGSFTTIFAFLMSILIVLIVGPSYDGTIKYDEVKNMTISYQISDTYTEVNSFSMPTESSGTVIINGNSSSLYDMDDLGTRTGPTIKYQKVDGSCRIELGKVTGYRDAETLANQYSNYHTDAMNLLKKQARQKANLKAPKTELYLFEKISWYQVSLDEIRANQYLNYKTTEYFSNLDGSVYQVRVKAILIDKEDEEGTACFDDARTFVETIKPQHMPEDKTEE